MHSNRTKPWERDHVCKFPLSSHTNIIHSTPVKLGHMRLPASVALSKQATDCRMPVQTTGKDTNMTLNCEFFEPRAETSKQSID